MQTTTFEIIVRCDGAEARRLLRREPGGWTVTRPARPQAVASACAYDADDLVSALVEDLAAEIDGRT